MTTRIAVDHHEVRRLVDELAGANVDRALAELAELLPDHFEYEERPGGFFARMVALGHDRREANRLIAEHAVLLEELRQALAAEGDARRDWVKRLADRLRRHEWDENCFGCSSRELAVESWYESE